jgi:hypothetical protein
MKPDFESTATAQNKALYRSFIDEVFKHGRTEKLGELLAPN